MFSLVLQNVRPAPKGSGTRTRNGGYIEMAGPRLQAYTDAMVLAIRSKMRYAKYPIEGPVQVTLTFTFPGPKKQRDIVYATTTRRGDIDKLQRAVLDACTQARLWGDDKQVVEIRATAISVPRELCGEGDTVLVVRKVGNNVKKRYSRSV